MKTQGLGIRVLTLMIADITPEARHLDTASTGRRSKLTSTTVAADPGFFFMPLANGDGVGAVLIVDPRTMTLSRRRRLDET
jgi:hypothetical protein